MKYRTIAADPPWPQPMMGRRAGRHSGAPLLSYSTMTVREICDLPIRDIAEEGAHLWLWTTNAFLRAGFDVMDAWGFTYLAPVVWVKPSGFGNYFLHQTQTCLFGYRGRCEFPLARYQPNVVFAPSGKHSAKPEAFLDFVEMVSPEPRVELFARRHRFQWDVWGNESANTATLESA